MLLRTPKHRMVLQVAGWAKIPANQMLVLTFLVRNPTAQTAGDTPRLTLSHGVGADGTPGGGAIRLGPLVAGYMRGEVERAFSYSQPVDLRLEPKRHPTVHPLLAADQWDQQGLLLGRNLGSADYSQRASMGLTPCEVSRWRSDSSLACLVAAGVGGGPACAATGGGGQEAVDGHCGAALMVTIIGALTQTATEAFQYKEPYTTSIIPKNGPTAGGYYVEAYTCMHTHTHTIHTYIDSYMHAHKQSNTPTYYAARTGTLWRRRGTFLALWTTRRYCSWRIVRARRRYGCPTPSPCARSRRHCDAPDACV